MTKKLLFGCLLMTALFFFSCDRPAPSPMNRSEASIETVSMITFLAMGIAIFIAYSYKKR
ncbi:hypothetical protein [Chryseobacterium indologenes]|uniref:Lipoprotein n=1 Tax=Chryseobacterium indologenes TaxID=253 RepID=A0A0N0ZYJ7_CHRID|nr:hypothetical protein [Chryseobacterium indologenes]KPE52635.1 hypothetical protein AOB46_01065 [Chryseobacterium indologenes]